MNKQTEKKTDRHNLLMVDEQMDRQKDGETKRWRDTLHKF